MIFSLGTARLGPGERQTLRVMAHRVQALEYGSATVWSRARQVSRFEAQGLLLESMYVGAAPVLLSVDGAPVPVVSMVDAPVKLERFVAVRPGQTVSATIANYGSETLEVCIAFTGEAP